MRLSLVGLSIQLFEKLTFGVSLTYTFKQKRLERQCSNTFQSIRWVESSIIYGPGCSWQHQTFLHLLHRSIKVSKSGQFRSNRSCFGSSFSVTKPFIYSSRNLVRFSIEKKPSKRDLIFFWNLGRVNFCDFAFFVGF